MKKSLAKLALSLLLCITLLPLSVFAQATVPQPATDGVSAVVNTITGAITITDEAQTHINYSRTVTLLESPPVLLADPIFQGGLLPGVYEVTSLPGVLSVADAGTPFELVLQPLVVGAPALVTGWTFTRPELAPVADKVWDAGDSIEIEVDYTGSNFEPASEWRIFGLPPGLTFANGVISGTPAPGVSGDFLVRVEFGNSNFYGVTEFTITVEEEDVPTFGLPAVSITNDNFTATSVATGTATGALAITGNNLPVGVTATVTANGILVTGVVPEAGQAPIIGNFTVTVNREGVSAVLAVNVNLTPPDAPVPPTFILNPASVTINDNNLTATSAPEGTAIGALTITGHTLPTGVTAAVTANGILVTGVRPGANETPITGNFTVTVSREGVIAVLAVNVNLTPPDAPVLPTLILNPASVTINNNNPMATSNVGGTATGAITFTNNNMPAGVTISVSGNVLTVTGARPAAGQDAISGTYTVTVNRQGETATFTVNINLTPLPPLSPTIPPTTPTPTQVPSTPSPPRGTPAPTEQPQEHDTRFMRFTADFAYTNEDALILLYHYDIELPEDFINDILQRDSVNDLFLNYEMHNFAVMLEDEATDTILAIIRVYVGDLGFDDVQRLMFRGFTFDPETEEYVVIPGIFSDCGNYFYFEFHGPGIIGAMVYELPVPLLRFTIGSYRYYYRGAPRTSDVAPFISQNRTMVPLRIVSEALGATPRWDDATRTAYIYKDDITLRLPADQPLPNGMGTPAMVNNRVLVPLRYVIENFDAITLWDPELREVTVFER